MILLSLIVILSILNLVRDIPTRTNLDTLINQQEHIYKLNKLEDSVKTLNFIHLSHKLDSVNSSLIKKDSILDIKLNKLKKSNTIRYENYKNYTDTLPFLPNY